MIGGRRPQVIPTRRHVRWPETSTDGSVRTFMGTQPAPNVTTVSGLRRSIIGESSRLVTNPRDAALADTALRSGRPSPDSARAGASSGRQATTSRPTPEDREGRGEFRTPGDHIAPPPNGGRVWRLCGFAANRAANRVSIQDGPVRPGGARRPSAQPTPARREVRPRAGDRHGGRILPVLASVGSRAPRAPATTRTGRHPATSRRHRSSAGDPLSSRARPLPAAPAR
jgi:hypothetical protein